jgi:tRNA(adenine34) deaminase
MLNPYNDEFFMKEALKEARKAAEQDEVPVGAVVVAANTVIARAHNMTEKLNDVTAHAEMLAITAAANHLGAKYLTDCKIYITLEPCAMCASALSWAQVGEVIWSASDPQKGFSRFNMPMLHPKTKTQSGIMADESSALLREFFAKKRKKGSSLSTE